MKKIKQVNGYTIYQATTQRDADNYNCQVGSYNIYIAQDIRDYGLTNSYPEYEDVDSLAVAIAYCNGSHYAVAVALADELSSGTTERGGCCMFRHDTYIGCEHYWVRYHNGTHEVRRETYSCDPDNETVFTGSYEQCLDWLMKAEQDEADSRF